MNNDQAGKSGEAITYQGAICGNCGKMYMAHHHENYGRGIEHYCFTHTNGDVFTDTPSDETLFEMACKQDKSLFQRLLLQWRKANGHEPLDATRTAL
jgi:ribosomal protein S27AE